jgi:CHAD domain-containing protein
MGDMTFQAKKWVACDDPTQLATAVVREALADRFTAVEYYLEPKSSDSDRDPEEVHQLRVSTRRADAALVAFGDFLPGRKSKKLRKLLKQMRRAAGEVRDNDVMAMRYSAPRDDSGTDSQDWIWARIVDARRAAKPGLDEIYQAASVKEFSRRTEKLLDRVRWRGDGEEPTFAALASQRLSTAANEFFSAAHERPKHADKLHELRIAGKRFRYAIELFAAVAPPLRDDVYPIIEEVQERLGKANDHSVAAKRISEWRDLHAANGDVPEGIARAIKRERRKATKSSNEFHAWWTPDRTSDVERRFREAMQSAVKNAENTESP